MNANATGELNVAVGFQSMATNTTGALNVAMGYQSMLANTTGLANVALGYQSLVKQYHWWRQHRCRIRALYQTPRVTTIQPSAVRHCQHHSTGNQNTAVGKEALKLATASNNVAMGYQALLATVSGANNTALGTSAMNANTTGTQNVALGRYGWITNTTGSSNTLLGYAADVSTAALTNATAIGANASVATSNSLVLGNSANVGIGTSSPLDKLHVVGNIRMVDGNQSVGRIMLSDANGTATWTDAHHHRNHYAWGLLGNASTVDGTNFIGTTDNIPVNIRVNNQKAGRISSAGMSVIGYQAGNSKHCYQHHCNGLSSIVHQH